MLWPFTWLWGGGSIPLCVLGVNGQNRQGLRTQEVNFRACRGHSCTKASIPWVTDIENRKPRSGKLVTLLHLGSEWRLARWKEAEVKLGKAEFSEGKPYVRERPGQAEVESWSLSYFISRRKMCIKARTQEIIASGGIWWRPWVDISGIIWSSVPWRWWPCLV